MQKGASRSTAFVVLAALIALSAASIAFFYSQGWILYYGDAESHLNIARRMSRGDAFVNASSGASPSVSGKRAPHACAVRIS